jgi:hypothetical protein
MPTSTFQYPTLVSRTLSPLAKSLVTVVARHDAEISDADLNLIQDLQSYKSENLTRNHGVTSGGTTYAPFQYAPGNPNTFFIPSFDVLFNGEIVSIVGQQSSDLTLNRIQTPIPAALVPGNEDARLFVLFLELWYQALNPITGTGYYQDPLNPGPKFFFPYGGIVPDPSNAKVLPDDSIDPFQGLFTTERAQIQWRLNVQRVALDYDFTQETFGFFYPNARIPSNAYVTAGAGDPGQIVYGQASRPSPAAGVSPLIGLPAYEFTNMGGANGDTGLWRCGDGNINNSLGTMDGYSYAMPVAIIFQRNTGNFDITNNIYGCASATSSTQNTGTLATHISGRYDSKLADQIFQSEVVDTRTTTSLAGVDMDDSMRKGFVDLITGQTNLAVSRFRAAQGNKTEAVGSLLDYYIAVNPAQVGIAQTVGTFDGYANGFSSDLRTFKSTQQITVNNKATGTNGLPWTVGDSFAIKLPQTSRATITAVDVTVLVLNSATGVKTPATLLRGQVAILGLNSTTATVSFVKNLNNTAFDPGLQNIYVTVSATYPAGGSMTTVVISDAIQGGILLDQASGRTLPVFGVSEYQVQSPQIALDAFQVWAINPEYSDIALGTKIWKVFPGSSGTVATMNGASQTTFAINCKSLDEELNGLYATRAWDLATGNFYNVASRTMISLPANAGIQHTIVLDGAVQPTSTVVFSIVAQDTAQLAYNAPVKGATQIEETVMFGNYTADSNFPMDARVVVESVTYNATTDLNTIVLGANGCQIKGISGDDTVRLVWGFASNTLTAYSVTSASLGTGTVIVSVPGLGGTVVFDPSQSGSQPFLFVGSVLPAFTPASTLTLQVQYVPYQGEGVINRDYDILHSEDNALITTNGTGAAPVIGLSDVFPYNRELPIITTLPAQQSWNDATLGNSPVATVFDSNFVAMRQNNVEHTFLAPLHTNDFIPPINKDTRKTVRFLTTGARGFSQAIPHLGYAIEAPTARTVLGQNLQSTQAPISLYVNNINGNDLNTGLTPSTAKLTIGSALAELPPVLRDPCTIILVFTGQPFSMSALQNNLQVIALGDGDIRSAKQYALGNLSRVIQNEGRLVIMNDPSATNPTVIDATNFSGFGDGPTAAFYIDTSRVILSGIQFQGFTNPAIVAYNSDIDFVNCAWTGNVQAGAYVGCDTVILDGGSTSLSASGTGHVLSQCNFTASHHSLAIPPGVTPQSAFFVGTRNSTMTLQQHSTGTLDETNITATTVVATAQLNSSIAVDTTFQSAGNAVISANSVLLRTVTVDPFTGGVVTDSSSSVVTQVG